MISRVILSIGILFNISLNGMIENTKNETLFFNKIEKDGPIRHTYFLRFRTTAGDNIIQSIKVDNGAEKKDYYVKMPSESKIVVPWYSSETEKLHVRIWDSENLISEKQDTNSIFAYNWNKKEQDIYELKSSLIKYQNQYYPIIALFAGAKEVASQCELIISHNSVPEVIRIPGDVKHLQRKQIVVFEPTIEWSTNFANHQMDRIKRRGDRTYNAKKDKTSELKEMGSKK